MSGRPISCRPGMHCTRIKSSHLLHRYRMYTRVKAALALSAGRRAWRPCTRYGDRKSGNKPSRPGRLVSRRATCWSGHARKQRGFRQNVEMNGTIKPLLYGGLEWLDRGVQETRSTPDCWFVQCSRPDYGLRSCSRVTYGRTLCPSFLSRTILSVPPRTRSMVSRYIRLRVTSGAFLYSS